MKINTHIVTWANTIAINGAYWHDSKMGNYYCGLCRQNIVFVVNTGAFMIYFQECLFISIISPSNDKDITKKKSNSINIKILGSFLLYFIKSNILIL